METEEQEGGAAPEESATEDAPREPSQAGMVPSARLRAESKAKRDALKRVEELEGQVAELEGHAARVSELEGQLARFQSEWDDERAVYQAGWTDPEAISVAKHLHGRLDESDRPPLAEWLGEMRKDPGKAPRALAAYLDADAGAEGEPAPRNMGARRSSPPANGAPTGGDLSRDQATERLTQLASAAQRTGDWTQYDSERPALLQRISQG